MSSKRFENKTIIVTGAAGGIGEAYARALAAEGANVVVADLADEKGKQVAADIGGVPATHINHLTPRVLDIDDLYASMQARGIEMIDQIQGPPSWDGPDVLLRLRPVDGTPAFQVLTPFTLDDGRAIVVHRGWVKAENSTQVPDIEVTVTLGALRLLAGRFGGLLLTHGTTRARRGRGRRRACRARV